MAQSVLHTVLKGRDAGASSFQLFLGGPKFVFVFFNATALLKNWKKTALHMCSFDIMTNSLKRSFFYFLGVGVGSSPPWRLWIFSSFPFFLGCLQPSPNDSPVGMGPKKAFSVLLIKRPLIIGPTSIVLHARVRIVKNELGGSATQQELRGWGVTMEWTGELGVKPPSIRTLSSANLVCLRRCVRGAAVTLPRGSFKKDLKTHFISWR